MANNFAFIDSHTNLQYKRHEWENQKLPPLVRRSGIVVFLVSKLPRISGIFNAKAYQNVHLAIRDQGWILDWARLRRYLNDKYDVTTAFAFIGYVPGNEALYTSLQQSGFIVIFKPTLVIKRGKTTIIKGNVDAELVLHTMIEWNNYDRAIIATGDGDFHCLVEHLLKNNKLLHLMIPNPRKYSALLRTFHTSIVYMDNLQPKLERGVHQKTRGSNLRTEP